jgi:hypothetical protein
VGWATDADLTAALWKLDPVRWRGKYKAWLMLMTACRFVGIAREDFVEWSTGDPDYSGDGDEIARLWEYTKPRHGGALFEALSEAGITITSITPTKQPSPGVHVTAALTADRPRSAPGRDWRSRWDNILRTLRPTENSLFTVACMVGELMAEIGKPKLSVSVGLLEKAAQANGLWRMLGPDQVRRTIGNGLHHVEKKVLGDV